MCLRLSLTSGLGCTASRMAAHGLPSPLLASLCRAAVVTLAERKPDCVNPSHCRSDKNLNSLPRRTSCFQDSVPSVVKPHLSALQGQAPIRQATPLQDALPGTLPLSRTPTLLIHSLDVHLNGIFPRKLSLDTPANKSRFGTCCVLPVHPLWYLLHESTSVTFLPSEP